MNSLPEGKLARTGVAGFAAIKMGMGSVKHRAKRPFMSKQQCQEEKNTLDDKNAKILFSALTQLRGTALKFAQVIGMDQGVLPESYSKELEKSFHQVPPLNRVLVRKMLANELGGTAESLFAEFDSSAFAAASLGQVHKAKLQDGTDVAVKMQYPGISKTIKSDMTLMRNIARGMTNTHIILQSLKEVEARLSEEVNYHIEAKNTQWFKDNVDMEGISIPSVYPDVSSKHVFTTSFIKGKHLNDWLADKPSQALRNKAAQYLYDFFVYSSQDLQRLHADPNPGNFLFHDDGTMTVIDFGCVRALSDTFTSVFPRLLQAYIDEKPEDLFPAYEEIGMLYENIDDGLYENSLKPFGDWVTLPFKSEYFDFAEHSGYTQKGVEPMKLIHKSVSVNKIAEEFVFHNRTIFGLYQIFEKMGATVKLAGKIV